MSNETYQIDVTKVRKVYSGRPGCACGCRGSYRYATVAAHEEGGTDIGLDEFNDKQVKKVVRILNMAIADGTPVDIWHDMVFAEINNRSYCAYFKI